MNTCKTVESIYLRLPTQKSTHQSALRILKSKKTGSMFVGKMSNSKAKKYEELIIKEMKANMHQLKGKLPITCAIKVELAIEFNAPKSRASLYKKDPKERFPMTVKPDWDNLAKIPFDCLVKAGIISDDSIIFSGGVSKYEIAPDRPTGMFFNIFIY